MMVSNKYSLFYRYVFILFANFVDALAARPPDSHEEPLNFWYWCCVIAALLLLSNYLCWPWLLLVFMGIAIGILGAPLLNSNDDRSVGCGESRSCHSGLTLIILKKRLLVYFRKHPC